MFFMAILSRSKMQRARRKQAQFSQQNREKLQQEKKVLSEEEEKQKINEILNIFSKEKNAS